MTPEEKLKEVIKFDLNMKPLAKESTKIKKDVHRHGFKATLTLLGRDIPYVLDDAALARLRTSSLIFAKNLSDRLVNEIRMALMQGIEKGEDMGRIANRLSEIFKKQDAMKIARTEVMKAVNDGKLDAFKQTGIDMVVLLAHPTACPECIALMDRYAKGIPLEKSYGILPAHPNCRCTFAPMPGGFVV